MKFNEVFGTPTLINLERRKDRLEAFDSQAKTLGITYNRFEAVRATQPILGCKLSHISVLAESDKPITFIFEDDSIFVDNFQEKFEKSMACVPDDWEMLYLGAHLLQSQRVNDCWVRSLECSSTHAYAVKADIIPRLIKQAMSMTGHTDVSFSSLHKEIKAYAARPTLVYQGASYSDLQKVEVDYTYLYF